MEIEKQLIITLAVNYDKKELEVFINSILRKCPNCDILFFCDKKVRKDITKYYPESIERFIFINVDFFTIFRIKRIFLINYLIKFLVLLLRINNFIASRKKINNQSLDRFQIGKYTLINSHFLLKRFFWYSRIKNDITNKYNYFYLTDCRDVLFQRSPLEKLKSYRNFIYTGLEPDLIKNNPINQNWIKQAYSNREDIYKKLLDSPIICAGVTLGSKELIFDYLDRIKKETINYIKLNKKNEVINLDQAFHNKIFSYDNIPSYRVDRENQLISTIGYFNKFDLNVDHENQEIIVNGKRPSIIHQYDRSVLLKDIINKWYSSI